MSHFFFFFFFTSFYGNRSTEAYFNSLKQISVQITKMYVLIVYQNKNIEEFGWLVVFGLKAL